MQEDAPMPEAPPEEETAATPTKGGRKPRNQQLAERAQGAAPAKPDPWGQQLNMQKGAIELALRGADGRPLIDKDKFVRVALTAIRKSPHLQQAEPLSLLGAIMACAQLGLEPSGPLGQAYLVPFYNSSRKVYEVQLILGYQGLIELVYRSGRVTSIVAHAVRERDMFDYEFGTNEFIRHKPPLTPERGEIVASYAVAKLVGGGEVSDVLDRTQIDARRARSRNTSKESPWETDYEAMARKSAVRQLFKWLPASVEVQAALGADGKAFLDIPDSADDFGNPDTVIDVEAIDE
jgi:recombination protein RecT